MSFYPIPESEAQEIYQGMEQAEANGFFDGMFAGECRSPELPSKEKLLQSIRPGMKLYRSFFLKVYSYGITDPEFPRIALDRLREAGCDKGDAYYDQIVGEYKRQQEEQQNGIGRKLSEQIEQNCENMCRNAQDGSDEQRTIELLQRKKQLLIMKQAELMTKSQR